MKNLRKILAIVLAMTLMLTFSVGAMASNSNGETVKIASDLIQSALQDPNVSWEVGNYSISDAIPTYYITNGNLSDSTEAVYHVIFREKIPVGILTINGANTIHPTYSLSEDFINELNEYILQDGLSYNLVVTENQIFAVSDNKATEIAQYDLTEMRENSRVLDSGKYVTDEYSTSEVESIILATNELNHTNSKNTQAIKIAPIKRAFTGITVPTYTQAPKSNCCWAASAWCVGETLNSLGETVEYCVEAAGKVMGNGGNSDDQKKILSEVYGLSPNFYNKISTSSMQSLIDNYEPFIMNCYKSGATLGHSVTCYGYDGDYSPMKLAVMDTLVSEGASNWKWMTSPASGTDYKITSAGTTYVYKNTVTPSSL